MLDWSSLLLKIPHEKELIGGFLTHTNSHGEVTWQTAKYSPIEGSFSSTVAVKSEHYDGRCSHLYISGNLVKFFQGHNIFGTKNLRGLVTQFVNDLVKQQKIVCLEEPLKYLETAQITRLDLTESFRLKDSEEVDQWIEGAELNTTMKYRGRGIYTRGTLYYGKHSQTWALKLYNKYRELKENKKHHKFVTTELLEHAKGLLRLELVLRNKELQKLNNDKPFLLEDYNELWYDHQYSTYTSKLEIGTMKSQQTDKHEELTNAEQCTYELHRNGLDVQGLMSKATFYRHKKQILEKIGVNIASNNVINITTKKLPSLEFIQATQEQIPDHFLNSDLYYNPSQLRLVG